MEISFVYFGWKQKTQKEKHIVSNLHAYEQLIVNKTLPLKKICFISNIGLSYFCIYRDRLYSAISQNLGPLDFKMSSPEI